MNISWLKNIVEKITIAISFKKINSPSVKQKNMAKKVNSQIGQQVNNYGLTYSDARNLVSDLVDQKLTQFKDEAELTYTKRINEFKILLIEKIKSLSEEVLVKLREPDTQLTLIEATKISGRKQNVELRNLLANLVINRIKNDNSGKEELKNIVYNEAISTINKLTVDQLKIITLCYLLRYTSYNGIVSWETFQSYLTVHIKPFLGFKDTLAEFQHIEYAGCGSISIAGWDLIDLCRQQYSFLFLSLVEKKEIDDLALSEEIKNEAFVLDGNDNKYFIRFRNKSEFEKYLTGKKVNNEILTKLISIYDRHIKNDNDIKKKILNETNVGNDLFNIWEKSVLRHLSLTSVGIAIGASYFEQVTGEKIDIGIWIN